MPKFEGYNPDGVKPEEKKEPANIIEYFEQDLQQKEELIRWLEIRKEALKDIIERSKDLAEDILSLLEDEIKEFEIEIKVNKSMIELTKQRLAEKISEAKK